MIRLLKSPERQNSGLLSFLLNPLKTLIWSSLNLVLERLHRSTPLKSKKRLSDTAQQPGGETRQGHGHLPHSIYVVSQKLCKLHSISYSYPGL